MAEMYVVVIVGAGPAGCACGIFLARSGLKVLILEGDTHPRHHIGESLLPGSLPALDRLGISTAELERKFQPKYGARFYDPLADELAVFEFDPASGIGIPSFQVVREQFDWMLAEKARQAGCELREATPVVNVHEDLAQVELRG